MKGLYKPGKFTLRETRLNYKHVFSMEFLYKRIHEWLIHEGYVKEGSGDFARGDSWLERLYLERVNANGAKQIWIWWRTFKDVNPYIRFHLDVDFQCLNLTKSEIVHEGTKVGTNKGEVEFFARASLEIDPNGDFKKNFLLKNPTILNWYLNRMMKNHIEQNEKVLMGDYDRILSAGKQYFQIESWLPEYTGKPFHPAKGH